MPVMPERVTPGFVAQPAPIFFQRKANRWLAEFGRVARELGASPVRVGGATIDVVDGLRSELNIQNGEALRRLHLRSAGAPRPDAAPRRRLPAVVQGLRMNAFNARRELAHAIRAVTAAPKGGGEPVAALFVPRLPDHLDDALPVARWLRDNQGVGSLFAVVNGSLFRRVREAGFAATRLEEWSGRSAAHAWMQARALRRRLLQAAARATSQELSAAEHEALSRSTSSVLRHNLAELLRVSLALDALIGRVRPSVVVAGNPYTLEGRLAAMVARSHGVRAASMEHGSIFPNDPIWEDCPLDHVFAWGEASRRALVTCGVAPERIAVTGAPRLDAALRVIAGTGGGNGTAPRPDAGDSGFILVATSGPGDQVSLEQHLAFIRMLYQAAHQAPEVRWLVKLHRKDRLEFYTRTANGDESARVRVVESQRERGSLEIYEYLRDARALVTICSTAAVDAMVAGVPVISVEVPTVDEKLSGVEFLERGCTWPVRSAAGLAEAASRAWRGEVDPAVDRAAREYSAEHFAFAGQAASRVGNEIASLLGELAHAR